jgi:hypothetical protein
MAFDKRGLADYVQVNERIVAFYEKYPEGSIQSEIVSQTDSLIVMKATAYRTPEDHRPGVGHSWLQIPGSTPYTRGSEIENAETSAWGRALAALGFEVKRGIASQEEVDNKNGKSMQVHDVVKSDLTDKPSTLTPAQADMMVAMLTAAQGAGHNIGNWLAVWGCGVVKIEDLTNDVVKLDLYAAVSGMSQAKGKERFDKGCARLTEKQREGLVWPE